MPNSLEHTVKDSARDADTRHKCAFTFQSRYVLFLDILGFKNKVTRAVKNGALFNYLIILSDRLATLTEQENWMDADIQCAVFSDCVVASACEKQHSPVGLNPLINIAKTLFWEFIERGAVVRGGIAKGFVHHSNGVVFGPAMNEAVELEKDIALFSRIVTTDQIANEWRAYWGKPGGLVARRDEIREDRDGVYYVDLFHFPEGDSLDRTTYEAFRRSGPTLSSMLKESDMSVKERSKVVWLARQYNESSLVATRRTCPKIEMPG